MTRKQDEGNKPGAVNAEKLLTNRQQEILSLSAAELSPADIAQRLGITVRTVNYHLGGAYRKLGARNRQEALQQARNRNLL